jgi:hypothetical protein
MTPSLFSIAFTHEAKCSECDLGRRVLCAEGRRLFDAAHEKCESLVDPDVQTPRGQA